MTKGILYCVCDQACEELCNICEKRERIKPDVRIANPTWPRKVTRRAYGIKSN